MDKKIIFEYKDAKARRSEILQDLEDLRQAASVNDKVYGSNPDFPYNPQSFSVSGVDGKQIDRKRERILRESLAAVENVITECEKIYEESPLRIQRIIRYRVFNRLTWAEVAIAVGAQSSESVRAEFKRWIKK